MGNMGLAKFADKVDAYMRSIIDSSLHWHDNELFKGKITMPQFIILDRLMREGQLNMTPLARYLRVTTAAVTGLVNRLVRQGCVKRTYDANDRRLIKVELTAKGLALVKKINAQRRRMIIRVFGELSGTDRSNYLGILSKVKDILSRK